MLVVGNWLYGRKFVWNPVLVSLWSVHSYWKLTIRNGGQLGNGQRGSASSIKTGYLTRVYLVSWINGFEMKGDHSR